MKDDKFKITRKKHPKGDDGYKIFSVRLKEDIIANLDFIANKTDRSRNELINILLEYAISNSEIDLKGDS